jgi:hypothetical protein
MLRLDEDWGLGDQSPTTDADPSTKCSARPDLKGLSAVLGLNDINSLTHKVENLRRFAKTGCRCRRCGTHLQAIDRLVAVVTAENPDAGLKSAPFDGNRPRVAGGRRRTYVI